MITPDGERHRTDLNIKPIEDVDLAVVQFNSENSYRVGKLGNSLSATRGKTVYVAGAPEPSETMPSCTVLVTSGEIAGRQKPNEKGYALIYTNPTRRGMSGGPVLDEEGRVIGIHGQGDHQDGSKTGLNLAIPIEGFKQTQRFPEGEQSPSDSLDAPESGKVGEGLSWPLIFFLGLAMGVVGGGAGLLWLGYLYGSRTKSQQNAKVIYNPAPRNDPPPTPKSREPVVIQEKAPLLPAVPNPVTPSRSEPSPPVKQPTIEHSEKSSEITPSRSEPSRPVKQPTILHVDHSEVAAKPEEPVPARYHKLRDLLAAGEWKEADRETARVMLQVASREKEGWLRVEDRENFPCEDLRAIDKLWVKYSNGRFGFSVQKRIWLERRSTRSH